MIVFSPIILFQLWFFHNDISLSSNDADDYDSDTKYCTDPLNYYNNNQVSSDISTASNNIENDFSNNDKDSQYVSAEDIRRTNTSYSELLENISHYRKHPCEKFLLAFLILSRHNLR